MPLKSVNGYGGEISAKELYRLQKSRDRIRQVGLARVLSTIHDTVEEEGMVRKIANQLTKKPIEYMWLKDGKMEIFLSGSVV